LNHALTVVGLHLRQWSHKTYSKKAKLTKTNV